MNDYDNKGEEIGLRESPDGHGKLTSWAREPDIRALKYDYDNAKPSHDAQINKIKEWQDLLDVKGAAKAKKIPGRSSVQPKLIRRQAEWRYSALTEPFLGNNKLFDLSPKTFEDKESVRQNSILLNWQWDTKINKVKFVDDMVRSTVDEGTCIIQTGWERRTKKQMKEVPVWNYYQVETQEQMDALQQAMQLFVDNPRAYNETTPEDMKAAVAYAKESGIPVYAEDSGQTTSIEEEVVLVNRPTAVVHDPNNVVIDPSCNGDFNKALFVVVSFETNRAELMGQGDRYKNLDKVIWDNNSPATSPDYSTNTPDTFQFGDQARKKVVAYEYWGYYDVHGNGELTSFVATWIGDTIIRMEENPFPDGKLPFVVIPYSPRKRELYGEPDAELLKDNQAILGAVMRGMIDLMGRSANGQTGFAKGTLDALNRRRYENGQDYEFNQISNGNSIHTHTFPEIPQSALTMIGLQNDDAESLSGVKAFTGGITGEALGKVATGIRGALDAASKREMAILRRLAKGVCEIGQKFISMNSEFLSEEEVVRVTNTDFITIRREDIKGEFDIEVDISTAEVDNAKSQDLAFMLQTIGPNTDPRVAMMILADIARLKRMPDLAERLEKWSPEPSEEEKELSRLNIEKARFEVEKLKSEVELNRARAQREMSASYSTDVKTELENSGITHARNRELQMGQAEGNQQYAITQALTRPVKENEKAPDLQAAIGWNVLSARQSAQNTSIIPPAQTGRNLPTV